MTLPLSEHISKFIKVSDEELKQICSFFEYRSVKKKELLLEAGQICKHHYFVENGCIRMYFIDGKGVEKTVQFAIENWWLSDYRSFNKKSTAEFYIQAVEKSDIRCISAEGQKNLLEQFPVMEKYFRCIHETAHAAFQYRSMFYQDLSKEELFTHFLQNFPGFVQRVPQYLLASYLGITPEYLSELRSKTLS